MFKFNEPNFWEKIILLPIAVRLQSRREEIKGNVNLYRPGPWKKEDGLEETVQDFKAT